MREMLPRRLVNPGVGAACLLLAAAWFSPASWAGCGHLARPDGAFLRLNSLAGLPELMASQGLPATAHLFESGSPERSAPSRPRPCSGPSCSGQVPLPFSTTLATDAPISLWGLLDRPLELGDPPARFAGNPQPSPMRSLLASSIFHPPRLVR